MKILIVPDKFKGTLTAQQAASAIAAGWKKARPEDELSLLPMSDGGDGFNDVLRNLTGAASKKIDAVNAAGEPRTVEWAWSPSQSLAILETAQSNGLAILPQGKWHPFDLDTFGVGLMIQQAAASGALDVVAGIGGSATNDAGFGMARALGYRFMDAAGEEILRWGELPKLQSIQRPPSPVTFRRFIIACDVQNTLLGEQGATRVYGPQKGLCPQDFSKADAAFERLAEVVRRDLGMDAVNDPGTGAAGGLGYGLRVFLNGEFRPGFEVFADLSRLRGRILENELVVTAEGAIDAQSQMGKGTGAVAAMAQALGRPCIGLAGYLPEPIGAPFTCTSGIHPALAPLEDAKARPAFWLEELANRVAAEYGRGDINHS